MTCRHARTPTGTTVSTAEAIAATKPAQHRVPDQLPQPHASAPSPPHKLSVTDTNICPATPITPQNRRSPHPTRAIPLVPTPTIRATPDTHTLRNCTILAQPHIALHHTRTPTTTTRPASPISSRSTTITFLAAPLPQATPQTHGRPGHTNYPPLFCYKTVSRPFIRSQHDPDHTAPARLHPKPTKIIIGPCPALNGMNPANAYRPALQAAASTHPSVTSGTGRYIAGRWRNPKTTRGRQS